VRGWGGGGHGWGLQVRAGYSRIATLDDDDMPEFRQLMRRFKRDLDSADAPFTRPKRVSSCAVFCTLFSGFAVFFLVSEGGRRGGGVP
jgi:hypothetical protein